MLWSDPYSERSNGAREMPQANAMKFPVYLDYSATTPVDPRVAEKMIPWLTLNFGNPASRSHAYGWDAEAAVEEARENVAALVNCDPKELVWTSGATESINLALKGAAHFYKDKGKHLVTVKTEHKATLDAMRELEREGFAVTYLDVGTDGLLDLDRLAAALQPDTTLVSVMYVNNEIGVVQDVAGIGALCRARGIAFHVDSAQATGKLAIDLATLPVDLMSFSAHKTYGPKASARSSCGASRARASRRKCTAAATSAACAPARCRRIRSSAWARRIASRASRWAPRSSASACCTGSWSTACRVSSRPS